MTRGAGARARRGAPQRGAHGWRRSAARIEIARWRGSCSGRVAAVVQAVVLALLAASERRLWVPVASVMLAGSLVVALAG